MKLTTKIWEIFNDHKIIILVIIILVIIYFFSYLYMRNKEYRVIVFDLDETLGNFVELGVFCDTIEKYNKKKLEFNEFYKIMDMFPEFLRPNIIKILSYLKEKRQKGIINKIYIYTNNQGPREWAEKIRRFLERKLNYRLFDKIIAAYKINGKIIEETRTTHEKTIRDLFRSTNIPTNSKICFIDDLYHPLMDNHNVYYINVKPYYGSLPFILMAERYYKQNMNFINNKSDFVDFIIRQMNQYDLTISTKSLINKKEDILMSRDILLELQNFLKIKNTKTKKARQKRKNISHKK